MSQYATLTEEGTGTAEKKIIDLGSRKRDSLAWLQKRERGDPSNIGQTSQTCSTFYNAVQVTNYWDPSQSSRHVHHGGIFNFDFSTDGTVLVAACEKKSFLVFDPFNGKLIDGKTGAHSDCVNCVRFLDTRTFATCSDDTTVALWDLRCLRNKVRSLQGHSNWVKNIEYASSTGQLVTSGFDGTIYTWDINNYSDQDGCKRVFYASGLMRSKLTPDDSKLVIATAGGYLLIIHDLDLEQLNTDMEGFKPHMYRLMQISGIPVATATAFNHMFERRRNRVELMGDFPKGNKAEVIASLQVHPQGWCVSSRNTSSDEGSEWTCVHDIHDQPLTKEDNDLETDRVQPTSASFMSSACTNEAPNPSTRSGSVSGIDIEQVGLTALSRIGHFDWHPRLVLRPVSGSTAAMRGVLAEGVEDQRSEGEDQDEDRVNIVDDDDDDSEHPLLGDSLSGTGSSNDDGTDNSSDDDVWLGRIPFELWGSGGFGRFLFGGGNLAAADGADAQVGQDPSQPPVINGLDELNRLLRATQRHVRELDPSRHTSAADRGSANRASRGANVGASSSSSRTQSEQHEQSLAELLEEVSETNRRILARRRNGNSTHTGESRRSILPWSLGADVDSAHGYIHPIRPRLLYYLREPNVGRGYIKEQCFSTDGRLIISPFGNGVRLLSFDSACRELCDCEPITPHQPRAIHELRSVAMHAHVALTTRFSPTHCLFVSGSLDGSVAFLQPYL